MLIAALLAALWPALALGQDVAAAPAAADPTVALLQTLGPTGGAGAVVALVWRAWRAEADRHAAERAELRAALVTQGADIAGLRMDLALHRAATDAALGRVRDLLDLTRAALETHR
jgi:hypothetical protein